MPSIAILKMLMQMDGSFVCTYLTFMPFPTLFNLSVCFVQLFDNAKMLIWPTGCHCRCKGLTVVCGSGVRRTAITLQVGVLPEQHVLCSVLQC